MNNITLGDVKAFVDSLKAKDTPWSLGLAALLTTLWAEVAEYREMGRSLYCTDCGSCGEPGCCPPEMCKKHPACTAAQSDAPSFDKTIQRIETDYEAATGKDKK